MAAPYEHIRDNKFLMGRGMEILGENDDYSIEVGKKATTNKRVDVKVYGSSSATSFFIDSSADQVIVTGITFVYGSATPSSVATSPGTAATAAQTIVGGIGGATSIATTGTGGIGGGETHTMGAGGSATAAVTAATGGAGGAFSVTTGAGGAEAVATVTSTGGAGGATAILTGNGGAVSAAVSGTATGGAGGAASMTSGDGGACTATTGTNVGGASGAINIVTGTGGAASGGSGNTGGAAGAINITAGNGGNGTQAGGVGGTITLTAGNAGTGGNIAGGNVDLKGGAATGTGTIGNVRIEPATATPAAGSTRARLRFGSTAGFGIYFGSGAPTVTAAQGSFYMRSDGSSTSTRAYINTDGATTWTSITTAA